MEIQHDKNEDWRITTAQYIFLRTKNWSSEQIGFTRVFRNMVDGFGNEYTKEIDHKDGWNDALRFLVSTTIDNLGDTNAQPKT